jgi:hypothetical protein
MYYVCVGFQKVGSKTARAGVEVSIMQMGQSSNSVGPKWTGISTRVSTTTTASEGLYILNNDKPTRTLLFTLCTQSCTFFFLRRLKNKPHEGAMNVRLFLGLFAQQTITLHIH